MDPSKIELDQIWQEHRPKTSSSTLLKNLNLLIYIIPIVLHIKKIYMHYFYKESKKI